MLNNLRALVVVTSVTTSKKMPAMNIPAKMIVMRKGCWMSFCHITRNKSATGEVSTNFSSAD